MNATFIAGDAFRVNNDVYGFGGLPGIVTQTYTGDRYNVLFIAANVHTMFHASELRLDLPKPHRAPIESNPPTAS